MIHSSLLGPFISYKEIHVDVYLNWVMLRPAHMCLLIKLKKRKRKSSDGVVHFIVERDAHYPNLADCYYLQQWIIV
jgi:hypothetical protein